jgi:tripartite-type tricarboxylate transporter receptor subunit TctC
MGRYFGKTSIRAARWLAGIGTLLFLTQAATAQEAFPNKPVRIIVPYSAGPTDVTARIYADAMSPILGVPVIVEGRAGANGRIALDAVKQAPADGYTVYIATPFQAVILPIVMEDPAHPFKTFRRDFRPIGLANGYDLAIVATPSAGIHSLRELIDRSRTPGAPTTYSTTQAPALGVGDIALQAIVTQTGANFSPIAYKGAAAMLPDLLAGRVIFAVFDIPSVVGHVKDGSLVGLATTGAARSALMPGVPTLAEAGFPEVAKADFRIWNAFFVPSGTPDARVSKLNEALRQATENATLKERFSGAGFIALSGANLAASQAFLDDKYKSWEPVLVKMGAKVTE